MQAVRFREYGDPAHVLRVEETPLPTPGPGEVRVRMLASPVNPSDGLFIEGRYGQQAPLPATPGFEGVGFVEATGGGLLGRLLVGRRVAAINRHGGNWAEQAIIPARQAVPLPHHLSLEQAATFFVNPATALAMTHHVLGMRRGEWLLQSAANSTLGRMIVRLGHHDGFRTLNIVRQESQAEELRQMGADAVLVFDSDRDNPEALVDSVRRHTGGGVRCAIDPVGGPLGSTMVRCLTTRGRLLTYGTLTDEPLTVQPRDLIGTQCSVAGFWLGKWMDEQSLPVKIRLMRQVARLIRRGILTSRISRHIPLRDVPATMAAGWQGKAIIVMDPRF